MIFRFALNFFIELYQRRRLIWDLAVRDFTGSYFGSTFGMIWVFVEPIIFMLIMWFFFTKAMKYNPTGGYPYLPWLMTSMILWNFFSAGVNGASGVFRSFSYLLKKWGFNISIVPVVNIISLLFVHLIFLLILFVLFLVSGIPFSWYWFQSIYYLFATCVLILGLSWIIGSISLFIKDIKNITGIILQLGYWISPIFWDINSYPEEYKIFMKLNPLYYVLNGYRKSFLYHTPFWDDWQFGLYYWCFTLTILAIGLFTYKKLRPHFGDVL